MNMVLIFEGDYVGHDEVLLSDYRAEHITSIHRAQAGQKLKVGLLNGCLGEGEILDVGKGSVRLRIALSDQSPTPKPINLVLGLPRPQTLKKVLESIATFGAEGLFLINTQRVQKSFFDSKILQNEAWKKHLYLGMEQGGQTRIPKIQVITTFHEFIKTADRLLPPSPVKLIADLGARNTLWNFFDREGKESRLTAAIGPEGGWKSDEVEAFERIGFIPINLGNTVHRVENAVIALCAQWELLSIKDLS